LLITIFVPLGGEAGVRL